MYHKDQWQLTFTPCFNVPTTLRDRCYYAPHFTDEDRHISRCPHITSIRWKWDSHPGSQTDSFSASQMYKRRFHLLTWGNTERQVCSESRHIELVMPVVLKENVVQHTGLELKRGLD